MEKPCLSIQDFILGFQKHRQKAKETCHRLGQREDYHLSAGRCFHPDSGKKTCKFCCHDLLVAVSQQGVNKDMMSEGSLDMAIDVYNTEFFETESESGSWISK